jgi:hypothetical protein
MTVSFETSAMRAVARMPHPSTRADTIWTRFAVLSTLAILDIMRERVGKVKRLRAIVSLQSHLMSDTI